MIQNYFETDVVSVTTDQTVADVVDLMKDHKIGDVIVVEDDAPVGIITDRDIALKVFSGDLVKPNELKVSDVMSSDIHTVAANDDLIDIVETMKDSGVVRLPVVDEEGKLCGVITDLHCMQILADTLEKVTHINQKDSDESTPPSVPTDNKKKEQSRQSLQ